MLNSLSQEPRIVDIPLSYHLNKFLKTLNVTTNNFLTRIAEDVLSSYKDELIDELGINMKSATTNEQREKISKTRDFVKNLERYSLEELRYGKG